MATLRFHAHERGGLLAQAILAADPAEERGVPTPLFDLAKALEAGEGRKFDELLVEHFREVALVASGLADGAEQQELEA